MQMMQITGYTMNIIEEVKSFNIRIYGFTYTGFVVDSVWEGIVCYKNSQGKVIAINHKGIFDNIFPWQDGKKVDDISIVMCSPCFQDKRGSNEHTNKKD